MLNAVKYGNGNNTATNNIFVDGMDCQLFLNEASSDKFTHNIVYYNLSPSSSLFAIAKQPIPCSESVNTPVRGDIPIGSSDCNLFFSPSGSKSLAAQLNAWKALVSPPFDQHSIVLDPLFADYAHDDFKLLPSSPALLPPSAGCIGFKPIDFAGLPGLPP